MNSLGQVVTDRLLMATPGSLPSRGLSRVRRALIRVTDPLVTYRIGDAAIRLPLSHDLPHFQKAFPFYSRNLGRIAALVHAAHPDLAVVDVGANVGDSVAIIRSQTHVPVLAIEGSRRFFALLEANARNLGPELYLRCAMVGATREQQRGGMIERGGSAHYEEDRGSSGEVPFETLSHVISSTRELNARKLLIKIDTDGLDCMIIKAEEDLLRDRRPVVFFEYDPFHFERYGDDGFAVFETLLRAGYSNLLAYENTGVLRTSMGLDQEVELSELAAAYTKGGGERYADLCVFHQEDADVFDKVKASETELFQR
jgi:FkbM family methyltransferase